MTSPDCQAIHAAFALARRARFVYVSTNGPDGYPNTRVMYNLLKFRAKPVAQGPASLPDGFGSWLGTNTSSSKIAELRRDPRVCLYFSDNAKFEGLTLTGLIEEVLDAPIRKAIWMDGWERYYAGGIDGGDFTVLRFVPQQGRYYHGLRVVTFDASIMIATSVPAVRGRRAR
jgi:general stress protein 26